MSHFEVSSVHVPLHFHFPLIPVNSLHFFPSSCVYYSLLWLLQDMIVSPSGIDFSDKETRRYILVVSLRSVVVLLVCMMSVNSVITFINFLEGN